MTAVAERRAVRGVRADELRAVVSRLEGWLGAPGQLVRTYPQVFGPERRAELFGLFEGDALLSHAACHAVLIRTEHGPVCAGMVGSVITAPEQRGRGLASELLQQIAQGARDSGYDLMMLWSDRWDFYQRLGFEPSGQQLEVVVQPSAARCEGIRVADFGDLWSLQQLHAKKPCAVERSAGELAILLSAQPMTTVVLERESEVVAYACHGKGMDFAGWWHEVGGSDEDVAELITSATTTLGLQQATVMLPAYRRDLLHLLGTSVSQVREGVSGLCLPLTERGQSPLFVDGLDSI